MDEKTGVEGVQLADSFCLQRSVFQGYGAATLP